MPRTLYPGARAGTQPAREFPGTQALAAVASSVAQDVSCDRCRRWERDLREPSKSTSVFGSASMSSKRLYQRTRDADPTQPPRRWPPLGPKASSALDTTQLAHAQHVASRGIARGICR